MQSTDVHPDLSGTRHRGLALDDYPIAYPVDLSGSGSRPVLDPDLTDDDVRISGIPTAPAIPLPPVPGIHNDFAAQALKGKDSIITHPGSVNHTANVAAADSRGWGKKISDWWNGNKPEDQETDKKVEESTDTIDAIDGHDDHNPLAPLPGVPAVPSDNDAGELDNHQNMVGPSDTNAPTGVPEAPDLRSIRQICREILENKSKITNEKFEAKKKEWTENHDKIVKVKDLLKLLDKCKNNQGGLDLTVKNDKTAQLIDLLEKRRGADEGPLPKKLSKEEYDSLFKSIKDEQDDLSFNNSTVQEQMKELSQERAELHQFMFSVSKADHETCRGILQRIR